MKEIQILFNTEMVRAILAGNKTITRRVIKPQPEEAPASSEFIPVTEFLSLLEEKMKSGLSKIHTEGAGAGLIFPERPVQSGDILWVGEAWAWEGDTSWSDMQPIGSFWYKADNNDCGPSKWKPPLHMPRKACRLFLEVVSVRVERLQDITEEDAMDEGVSNAETFVNIGVDNGMANRYAFRQLWQSIKGPESWDKNPWVWVIEFKRLENYK